MAKQGPPHEVMADAIGKRLRQNFPEPPAIYSFGKVHRVTGLKPDIHIRHSDGREWAFEMVHGNRQAKHLLDNHARYAKAGVRDIWILWDALRPKTGSMASLDQGVMPSVLEANKTYPLNSTHKAILQMQTGEVRYLYAFSLGISRLDGSQSPLFETMMIGVDIYRFNGWCGQSEYLADYDFAPLAELEFAADGSPVPPVQDTEGVKRIARQLGLDVEDQFVPSDILDRVNSLLRSPEGLGEIVKSGLADAMRSLSPSEIQEMGAYLNDDGLMPVQELGKAFVDTDANRALKDGIYLIEVPNLALDLKPRLDALGMPSALRRILLPLIDPQTVSNTAELMAWQSQSDALKRIRASNP